MTASSLDVCVHMNGSHFYILINSDLALESIPLIENPAVKVWKEGTFKKQEPYKYDKATI